MESDWTVDKNCCSDTDTEESYEKEDFDSEKEQQTEHNSIDDSDKIGETRCQQARRPAPIVLDNNVDSRHIDKKAKIFCDKHLKIYIKKHATSGKLKSGRIYNIVHACFYC
ncbi:hypothetical protein DPMN_040343 [Dreissena polymorpha]|uniref:Uncharacterized protein n=1 Tax=Dreissena polymorpha TaxID=45954 RepID=A0A9D4CWI6_DREPO|nr:hypothetical protein DPMN_040343 [Dreissena polymorpha]